MITFEPFGCFLTFDVHWPHADATVGRAGHQESTCSIEVQANQTIGVPVEFERAALVSTDVPQDHRRVETAREEPLVLRIPEQTLNASSVAR